MGRARGTSEGGYQQGYAVYAATYGAKGRTIKRWVAHGRAKSAPPPLDSPRLMPAWWAAYMINAVPAGISRAAALDGPPDLELSAFQPAVAAPAAPAPPSSRPSPPSAKSPAQPELPTAPAAPPAPSRPPQEILPAGDAGLGEELARAKSRSATAQAVWEQEMRASIPDAGRIDLARRQCEAASENVRKLNKDANQEAIALREYLPRREVETVVGELGQQIKSRIDGLGPTLARVLGIPFSADAAAAWQAELDQLFASLQSDLFPLHAAA